MIAYLEIEAVFLQKLPGLRVFHHVLGFIQPPKKTPRQTPGLRPGVFWEVWASGLALAQHLGGGGGELVRGRRCLELGAGLGLVGLTAAKRGAREVWGGSGGGGCVFNRGAHRLTVFSFLHRMFALLLTRG